MNYIATRTFTYYVGRKPIKLVKGEGITDAQYAKLTPTHRQNYTALMPSQVARRIPNRRAQLDNLQVDYDVNLIVMEEIVNSVPDETIRGWNRNQVGKIRAIEAPIIKKFGLADKILVIPGLVDDEKIGTEANAWKAWPVEAHLEPAVREMARQLIADKWGY